MGEGVLGEKTGPTTVANPTPARDGEKEIA